MLPVKISAYIYLKKLWLILAFIEHICLLSLSSEISLAKNIFGICFIKSFVCLITLNLILIGETSFNCSSENSDSQNNKIQNFVVRKK